jgi:rod shape-determining protein MreC
MLKFLRRHKRQVALTSLIAGVGVLLLLRYMDHRIPGTGKASRGVLALFVPAETGAQTILHLPEKWIHDFSEYRRIHQENERLRKELSDLQLQVSKMRMLESDNLRMKEILKIKPPVQRSVRLVEVVAQDASTWNSTFIIGAGRKDGMAPDSPVVTPQGVVGKVVDVFPTRSRVLLAESPTSNVAVVDTRSQVRGVAVGTGGTRLKMEFIASGADVQSGDVFVSSGMGGVFPRGYPVGTVVKKGTTNNGLLLDIELAPAVDFGSVDFVYVLEPVEDLP